MNRLLISLVLALIPALGFAQTHNEAVGGNKMGPAPLCARNSTHASLNAGDTKWNYLGCESDGSQLVSITANSAALPAGTALIGKVGIDQTTSGTTNGVSVVGETVTITNAVTVTAAAYTAGNLVGGKNTLASAVRTVAGSGVIQSVMIADKAAQAGSYDVVYFSADPSGTTFTDKAAFTPVDADLLKIICTIPVTSTSTFADNGITTASSVGCAFEVPSGTSIYAAIVARSAPTYASTSDVQLRTTIFQD